jgi:flavin-dependent dehydrogenase
MIKQKVLIVGGGTAGWMTACLMAKRWVTLGHEVALVESKNIATIGVGEGSTPYLKKFFDYLDVDEKEWMPLCNATFKANICFKHWSTVKGFEQYSHPFPSEVDQFNYSKFFAHTVAKRKGIMVEALPDKFLLGSALSARNLEPLPSTNFPFESLYGYHFDAVLLGTFLQTKAVQLGVKHHIDDIDRVTLNNDGNIASVQSTNNDDTSLKTYEADIFVDCTGFASRLSKQALNVPYVSFSDELCNDSAVTISTAVSNNHKPVQTISTALSNGWAWAIPLTNRVGNGYVYSSSYLTKEQAENELRRHIGCSAELTARHLTFNVGRLNNSWTQNCVAIGLSHAFVEPLEATAIHMIQYTIEHFIDELEHGDFTTINRDKFNQSVNATYDSIKDYIVAHYRTNSRRDSQYWLDNANNNNVPQSVREMFSSWIQGGDLQQTIERLKLTGFDVISWHCLLAGMGMFPPEDQVPLKPTDDPFYDMTKMDQFLESCSLNFNERTI